MLCERHDADVALAARTISVATLLSVATIPLVLLVCGG
jgi:predicted permease